MPMKSLPLAHRCFQLAPVAAALACAYAPFKRVLATSDLKPTKNFIQGGGGEPDKCSILISLSDNC